MKSFLKSFYYAGRGVITTLQEERNFKIQIAVAVATILLGGVLHLNDMEWFAVGLCICLMLTMELINTTIENTCDAITDQESQLIKKAKDAAAGACLLTSGFCAIVGIVIFMPKVILLF